MRPLRHFLPVLATSLIVLIAVAASASAEVRTGEGTSPVDTSIPAEIDLLKATAEYNSESGLVSFLIDTRDAGSPGSNARIGGFVVTTSSPCVTSTFESEQSETAFTPFMGVLGSADPEAEEAEYIFFEEKEEEAQPVDGGPALKSVDATGTQYALSAAPPIARGRQFTCAVAETRAPKENPQPGEEEEYVDLLVFPIAVPPAPPTPVTPTVEVQTVTKTVTQLVSPPASAPAALSLAKTKGVSAGSAKFSTAKLVVTNTGGTASGPVQVKLKAPKGVLVKPGTLRLPALLPGQSWTLPVRVKTTEAAKKTSSIGVTATLPGSTVTGTIVVKNTA